MGWVINGLSAIMIKIITSLMDLLLNAYALFDIDIGYDASRTSYSVFDLTYYSDKTLITGMLDKIFPSAGNFLELFLALGLVLTVLIAALKLFQGIMSPLSEKTEEPGRIVARMVIAILLVGNSYSLFIIMEKCANWIYSYFKGKYVLETGAGLSASNLDALFPVSGEALGATVLVIIFMSAMLLQFARLMLEAYERYVLLAALFYTCPLAFSCYTSEGSSKILSNWLKMVLSQFILMFLNIFFITVFVTGYNSVFTTGDGGYIFESSADFIVKIALLMGWLVVGQKVDEHLRALGLSVASTGAGLGGALMGGLIVAREALRLGAGAVRTGARLGDSVINHTKAGARIKEGVIAGGAGKESPDFIQNHGQRDPVTGQLKQCEVGRVMDGKAEGQVLKGRDAENAAKATGVDMDSGAISQVHEGRDQSLTEVKDGLITSYQENGEGERIAQGQIGNAALYEVEDGAASIGIRGSDGKDFVAPATQEVIDFDAKRAEEWANESGEALGTRTSEEKGIGGETLPACRWEAERDEARPIYDEKGERVKDSSGNDLSHYTGNVYEREVNPDGSLGAYTGRVISNASYSKLSETEGRREIKAVPAGKTNPNTVYELMDYRPNADGSGGKINFSPAMVTAPKPAASSTSLVRKNEKKSKAEKDARFKSKVGVSKDTDKKDLFRDKKKNGRSRKK